MTQDEFVALAVPHTSDLFRTAVRVLGDRSDAEELTQETFLQAWKSFHRFERGTNIRAWLFKILFHVIHHHRRKWFNLKWKQEDVESYVETLAYEPAVPEELTDEDVLSALDRIPESFRSVVLLADVQELSYKEVAEVLGIPLGTVMSRLSRGRKLLRAELSQVAESFGFKAEVKPPARSREQAAVSLFDAPLGAAFALEQE
jgi:RNA polymerase sigma-70 factor (ECF subfamily)